MLTRSLTHMFKAGTKGKGRASEAIVRLNVINRSEGDILPSRNGGLVEILNLTPSIECSIQQSSKTSGPHGLIEAVLCCEIEGSASQTNRIVKISTLPSVLQTNERCPCDLFFRQYLTEG